MPAKAPVRANRVYARVCGGSRQLWCPDCGTLINHKQPVWQVLVRVTCQSCDAVFYWGSTLYRPAPGVLDVPDDVLTPQFADVYPSARRKGQPVNRLRQLNPDGSWTEL